jgi:hypothetical protein
MLEENYKISTLCCGLRVFNTLIKEGMKDVTPPQRKKIEKLIDKERSRPSIAREVGVSVYQVFKIHEQMMRDRLHPKWSQTRELLDTRRELDEIRHKIATLTTKEIELTFYLGRLEGKVIQ